jgi:hypothetical protein
MPHVSIHSLGYTILNVPRLCKLLNSYQNYYTFGVGTTITNIGEPDLSDYGYSVAALSRLVEPHLQDASLAIMFTSVPIEDDFFTKTLKPNAVVSTFYQTEGLIHESRRSPEEYAAITIAQELISFEFKRVTESESRKLFHQDPRGCLFDFCGIKSQKIWKLANCSICETCLGMLTHVNANAFVTRSARRILDGIAKPRAKRAMIASISLPPLSFLYGGIVIGTVVNVCSSLILSSGPVSRGQMWMVFATASGVVLFPFVVYLWHWYQFLTRKMS